LALWASFIVGAKSNPRLLRPLYLKQTTEGEEETEYFSGLWQLSMSDYAKVARFPQLVSLGFI
jgi:hypothetical protein